MGIPLIKLGLVGAIAESAMSVLNPLLRQSRLQLNEVFDPCLARAQADAQHLDASFSPSLDGMLRRCDGVVIGDVKWMGVSPLLRAVEMNRPVLMLQTVVSTLSTEQLTELQQVVQDSRVLLMPDLSYRWARSTLRMRELTATQAGAIERLVVTAQASAGSMIDLMVIDWCCNVMQSECRSVEVNSAGHTVELGFRRLGRDEQPVSATIQMVANDQPPRFAISQAEVTCRHGRILLAGEESIEWEIERQRVKESLVSDRSASDVMFDLFGRRLVGGLVPVPELGDVIKAHQIRNACLRSLECGERVLL